MDKFTLIGTIVVCFFGSGGIVLWMLNRIATKNDQRSCFDQDIKDIKRTTHHVQQGLIMALENDKVIFKSLRTHEINGESEEQEKKMDEYFLSLLGSSHGAKSL